MNESLGWDYQCYYWHTKTKTEVDFVFYGPRGFHAVEVKSGSRIRQEDLVGLTSFSEDYPESKLVLVYGGQKVVLHKKIKIIPAQMWFKEYPDWV